MLPPTLPEHTRVGSVWGLKRAWKVTGLRTDSSSLLQWPPPWNLPERPFLLSQLLLFAFLLTGAVYKVRGMHHLVIFTMSLFI